MADQPDFIDALQMGRDAVRKMQDSFARYALAPEQRQALSDGMAQMLFPTDGVRAMSDFIDAFGPPLAQIESLREELAEQRDYLRKLDDRLAVMQATAERLALASEQIRAFQEPFARMASAVTGVDFRSDADSDSSADSDGPT